ncbi:MAG TPA: DJ-1/PfpI family protein [Thermoanaerobaculia bacterium]|nr:DJ-1/PfpI family protein [Thermoanaerobaculia bacterium]
MTRRIPRRAASLLAVVLLALAAIAAIAAIAGCRASERTEEPQAAASPAPTPAPVAAAPAPTPAIPATGPMTGETQVPGQTGPAPDLPQDRPLRAGFLVVNGVYNTELAAPYDVFHHTQFHTRPGVQVFTVSPDGRPVTTFEGLKLTPDFSFSNAPPMDVLVIPSARGSMDADLQNPALINWVRTTGGQARHVLSLCDGAFLLAKAGLLQGIPATTFPEDYGRFSQMFPGLDLRINVSFVDAGKVITSQGGARSYEAAMHLVDRLYGRQVAEGIGKGLLVPWPPDPDTMTARIIEPKTPPAAAPAPTPAPQGAPGPG